MAKIKGYKVLGGNYVEESPLHGPVYLLEGDQYLKAWFNTQGVAKFIVIEPEIQIN